MWKNQNTKHKTQNTKHKTQNTKHKTQIANRKSQIANCKSHQPPLRMDVRVRRVWKDGQELYLTRLEYDLLEYLAERNGIVVTYQELWHEVWQSECRVGATEITTMREAAKRLRRKLYASTEICPLENVRGIGFRLAQRAVLIDSD